MVNNDNGQRQNSRLKGKLFFCKKPTVGIGIHNNANCKHLTDRYNARKKYYLYISIRV